jgi:hypothetical protein
MTTDAVAVPPDDVASHVNVVPAVSVVTEEGSQPLVDDTGESGSWTSQLTDASDTYQPLLPSVPLTVGVITGGVMSSVIGRQSQTPRHELGPSAAVQVPKLPSKTGCV